MANQRQIPCDEEYRDKFRISASNRKMKMKALFHQMVDELPEWKKDVVKQE